MLRFRQMRSLRTFAAKQSSVHAPLNLELALYRRDEVKDNRAAELAEWRRLGASRTAPGSSPTRKLWAV